MSSQSDLDQPGPPNITVDDLQLAGKRRRQRRASSGLIFFFEKIKFDVLQTRNCNGTYIIKLKITIQATI